MVDTVRILTVVAVAAIGALSFLAGTGPAVGQAPPDETARWQRIADDLRLPLVAPVAPPAFALQSFKVTPRPCAGEFIAQVLATYLRPDGARLDFSQAYPRACGDFGDVESDGNTRVRGYEAVYLFAGGGGPCFTGPEAAPCNSEDKVEYADSLALNWEEQGEQIGQFTVFSNLIAKEPIEAFAASLVTVTPSPSRQPLWVRERAQVVSVLRGLRLRVTINGARRTVALAGVRAPRTCKRAAALRTARGLMPRGRSLTLETDPTRGGSRRRVFAYRSARGYGSFQTLNSRLVSAGLARVVGQSRFRRQLLFEQRDARREKKGVFGRDCFGAPPTRRRIQPPEPVPPTPATPGDIYNCDDFPLSDGTTAQDYIRRYPSDPSNLDGNDDGVACE